jgi:hypothetical protein
MDKLFEEFALSSGSATLAKIDGVVYDGTFPDNAHHYYTHIDSDEAPFKVKSDNCFYCNSYVGNSHSQGFIDPEGIAVEHIIPTGFEQYSIDGGHVKICKSCNLILGSKLQDTYMSHLLSFCGLDVCRKCGDQYLVTNSEIDARNAAQTFGKHMCPECCYTTLAYDERLMNYEGDNLFAPYSKIIRDGDHKINRYYAQECYYCSEPIGIDLSVHPEETVKRFVSSQGHFTCEECMFRDNSPIKVLNKKDIIIRVYEINNKFYIKKTSVGGKILSFHTSLDSDTALDLLLNEYDDRQLKLI